MKDLANILPLHLYGKGQANSYNSLLEEIASGEAVIVWEGETPVRYIDVAIIYIKCCGLVLHEKKQVFNDGRVRNRGFKAISEKFMPNELPRAAARRALMEEIGLSRDVVGKMQFKSISTTEEKRLSPAYPGLLTRYRLWKFETVLPIKEWRPWYVEQGLDKRTIFGWRLAK